MALPKINLPISELILPSTGEKTKYRPFSVAEEKILLVAQEEDNAEQEVLAMKQIISNCLIEKDVEELALFDFEYVYLTLRARSVDNLAKFKIKDPDTDEEIEFELDMREIDISGAALPKAKIVTPATSSEIRRALCTPSRCGTSQSSHKPASPTNRT